MKVKNIKSFIDFYKSLEISTCIAPFPRFLDKKNQKDLCVKQLKNPASIKNSQTNKYGKTKDKTPMNKCTQKC